ncbi:glycosyltransferase family 2 protein [Cohnella laeviribosi]|uniref:glycosyltransferase family 2 protein n=1 Tax=Cohnella laeviribosi TaxID=380174 RepID=UPI003D228C10
MSEARKQTRGRSERRPPRTGPVRRPKRSSRLRGSPHPNAGQRYDEGFRAGYEEGVQFGMQSFGSGFEGTSIIIPTYNQLGKLKLCIASIMEHTHSPYEIIVVDNASTDGTAAYLRTFGGQVRSRMLDANRGFAGAVNVGLMMAKGSHIVLLNNDTVVTERWLDNMLACLNSDERIGMVGPVTNYASGEQQIPVPYDNVRQMPRFAAKFNRSDSSRWRRTDRLVGFCLLFRRELFERIGYFDEGFELGNFEDDDYNIRVRLLGRSLVIAKDTFIHHFGSVSIRALGDRFAQVNDRNKLYFADKWQNPYEWIHRVLQKAEAAGQAQKQLPGMTALYPDRIAVQGIGAGVYWIEDGKRHPVEGQPLFPVTRVSQVDLKRWPAAAPIGAEEAARRWQGEQTGIVMLPDGTKYHREGGCIRRIASEAAMRMWHFHLKRTDVLQPEDVAAFAEGLPIVAPPVLRQRL